MGLFRRRRIGAKPRELVSQTTLDNAFDRRTFVIGAGMGGIGTILAARMAYIGIAENERWVLESESNRVNLSLIPPRRGWILDRNGAPLASNRADFRVDVIPDRISDKGATITELAKILDLSSNNVADITKRIDEARGFQPIEVATGLDYDQFAAISVRLPDLPGVVPQRGFSRFYPTGPSVGHLIGYVGPASAEEYEERPDPILITPGYKIGKDALESQFEDELQGEPGARRVEVTASGRIVRDLETREDKQGAPVRLTIDGPLQDYAARRIGLESGSCVVMDCESGDILCMSSMPSFDPNSFSAGIGRVEYSMLRDDERVPLRNKVLSGLYPPGSTVKPMHCMAFLDAGIKPEETIICGGGRRIGNRFFNCWSNHGQVDMAKAIYQSCDSYFYHFAQQIGFEKVAEWAHKMGLGEEFDLPVTSQFYGTVPEPSWKQRKYDQAWQPYDTVNASIGQGYYLVNPLQLAVMTSRLATGYKVVPHLRMDDPRTEFEHFDFSADEIDYVRKAMSDVVNGPGTAGRARLPIEGVQMAGKTGTAQVVSLSISNGKTGPWKYRDHGLFVFFAPFDKPKYAGAVVIEHGGGSGSAYPIARDVMTFLLDPVKGMEALRPLEEQWGGNAQQRLDAKYRAYAAAAGEVVQPVPQRTEQIFDQVEAEARLAQRQSEAMAAEAVSSRNEGSRPPSSSASTSAPTSPPSARAPAATQGGTSE
ncbi:penicillin-binding protein 2 [Erythrobacter sp. SD-21]|uniref:penicillin-binding protein 2 n=1 Tax=Erythrobacter sp. SD-21 TaxID=161528 RepID=UPI000153F655|nr:penicillin-binding protein 2 [Erythrobacter sp. SD-21]EDL50225.1 cell division protein [Erythrobacter sp. SD-21]